MTAAASRQISGLSGAAVVDRRRRAKTRRRQTKPKDDEEGDRPATPDKDRQRAPRPTPRRATHSATPAATPEPANAPAAEHRRKTPRQVRRRPKARIPAPRRTGSALRSPQEIRSLLAEHDRLWRSHRHRARDWPIAVEVRTINNRHFKLNLRSSEGYGALEPHREPSSASTSAAAPSRSTCGRSAQIRPATTTGSTRRAAGDISNSSKKLRSASGACEELRLDSLAAAAGRGQELGATLDAAEPTGLSSSRSLSEAMTNLARDAVRGRAGHGRRSERQLRADRRAS